MREPCLWHAMGQERVRRALDRAMWLVPDRSGKVVPSVEPHRDCVQIVPAAADSPDRAIALALIPDAAAGRVACNGLPLAAAAHELRHADLLEVGGEPFWVSVDFHPDEAVYEPGPYPPDAFCVLLHVRLCPNDPIVVCCGTAEVPCGLLFRRDAWVKAQASSTSFKCPSCGYDPARARWTPPAPHSTRSLTRLFQLVARESRRHEVVQSHLSSTPAAV